MLTFRVVVKYCETCKTYRPPRSSHCRLVSCLLERADAKCGNCVDGIGQCYGAGNVTIARLPQTITAPTSIPAWGSETIWPFLSSSYQRSVICPPYGVELTFRRYRTFTLLYSLLSIFLYCVVTITSPSKLLCKIVPARPSASCSGFWYCLPSAFCCGITSE